MANTFIIYAQTFLMKCNTGENKPLMRMLPTVSTTTIIHLNRVDWNASTSLQSSFIRIDWIDHFSLLFLGERRFTSVPYGPYQAFNLEPYLMVDGLSPTIPSRARDEKWLDLETWPRC